MTTREHQQRRRERRQQISSFQIVFVSILAIGLLLTINFSARIRRSQQFNDIRNNIQLTIDVLEDTQVELKKTQEFVASDAAVEQWAHREGKQVREGERLVVPIPGLPPIPTPTPRSTTIPREPETPDVPVWKLWWNLFFDEDAPWE